ncbi:MAG: S8 family serine peptidase [Bacteroidota bacterium]
MDEVDWSKLDDGLTQLYQSWKLLEEHGWSSGYAIPDALKNHNTSLLLTLVHEGDLQPISDLGFKLHDQDGPGVAYGHLKMEHVAAVSRHENCLQLKFGSFLDPDLGTSAIAIQARDADDDLNEGLWHFDNDPPAFSGNAGAGVVIGIIDSGIDHTHQFFRTLDGTSTRIMSIWDMALTPTTGESSPNASLVRSGTTYGVEYTQAQINAVNNGQDGALAVRHRDGRSGHGTHVAGIAAGNGRPGFEEIGVAPQATIIAVNYIPSQGNVTVGGSTLSNAILFRDALEYIRRKARLVDTASPDDTIPVVINCSFGNALGPHDGRSISGPPSQESYLRDFRLDSGGDEIPGSVVVFSSGNYAGKERHLRVVLDGNTLTIPFSLVDARSTPNGSRCSISGWYANDSANPANVTVEIEVPGTGTTKTGTTSLGNNNNLTFDASNDKRVDIFHSNRRINTAHYGNADRNYINIFFTPFNQNFLTGSGYNLIITGNAGTQIDFWITASWTTVRPEFDLSGITDRANFENQSTCGKPGHSPDVITVANYNDLNNQLASSSSRGPLMNYSSNPFPTPSGPDDMQFDFNKPNIAAPGVDIKSAGNGFVERCKCCQKVQVAVNYTDKTGTSMSCPHVTGVVALMLSKNKTLNQSEVQSLLEIHADNGAVRYLPDGTWRDWNTVSDTSPSATTDEIGSGKLSARDAVQAVADPNTP